MKSIKTRLLLPEYGRNVQEMVKYLKTIEDRDKRNEQAKIVVAIMGNIYPHKRDSEEFRHMLWDHLYMIADFDIDIDSPYPQPTPDVLEPKPDKLPYTQGNFTQRQYGTLYNKFIKEVVASDASNEDKNAMLMNIAKYIRQQAYNYNHEYPSNDVVIAEIKRVCNGDFDFNAEQLSSTKVEVQQPQRNRNNNQNSNKKGGSQQQNNRGKGRDKN